MRVAERLPNLSRIHPAAVVPWQVLHRRADDHGKVARLVRERMIALAGDDLATARHLRHERHEVAHRAAGYEERRLLARQLRRALLESNYGRVIAEDVVADFRVGHGMAH